MPTAKLANCETYYEIHGQGDPIVLVCGLSIDLRFWQAQIRGLSPEFQVIAFDNRDTGKTTTSVTEYGIDDLADDVAHLLQELKLDKVHLLGFSMGGFIAQSFAARYPDKLKSLILAGTTAKVSNRTRKVTANWLTVCATMPREEALKEMFLWVYSTKFYEDDKKWRNLLAHYLSIEPSQTLEQFARQARSMRQDDFTQHSVKIKAPTLVLAGSEERVFTVEECSQLAKLIAGAELHVFTGLAHNFCVEDPHSVNEKIAAFCRKHK